MVTNGWIICTVQPLNQVKFDLLIEFVHNDVFSKDKAGLKPDEWDLDNDIDNF